MRVVAAWTVKPQNYWTSSQEVLVSVSQAPAGSGDAECLMPPRWVSSRPAPVSVSAGLLGRLLAGLKPACNESLGRHGAPGRGQEKVRWCQGSLSAAVQMRIRREPARNSLGLVIKGSVRGKHQALPFKAAPAN